MTNRELHSPAESGCEVLATPGGGRILERPAQVASAGAWRPDPEGTRLAIGHLLARERQEEVSRLLDQLTRRKRRLLVERFGFEGRHGATLEELAEAEQVSTGRIGQILTAALRKLARGTHFDEAGHLCWRLIGRASAPGSGRIPGIRPDRAPAAPPQA
jgi:hypothetical protein